MFDRGVLSQDAVELNSRDRWESGLGHSCIPGGSSGSLGWLFSQQGLQRKDLEQANSIT